jgi:hypothetical protein
MKSSFLQFLVFVALASLAACSNNSTITRSYVDPGIHKLDLRGVLVVGVAQQQSSRIDFENSFAKSLERKGARAVASHTLNIPLKAEPEVFIAAAKEANLDTILVTRFVGEKAEEIYHPGTIYYGVMPSYGGTYNRGGFGGYYGHAYEVAYDQPVWSTNKTYTLISDLFATSDQNHLWQVVSDTMRSGSDGKLRDDVIKGFVGNMKDEGLLD